MKVVVIGAGASGIIAALVASKNNEVILLDRNDKCAKKILVTGNGRCNYWNSEIGIDKYNTDNVDNLIKILEHKNKVLEYLTNLGIYPKIKNGYYYPNSNQAASVQELLTKELMLNNVNVVNNCKVEKVEKVNNNFEIKTDTMTITCDKVIIATGSKSSPKTGTDGSSFELLKEYHTINKVLPSLVPVKVNARFLKDWNNLRVDANVKLYINNKLIKEESGEVQLTDYGVSGIPIFNLSGIIARNLDINNSVNLKLDFLNGVDVLNLLNDRSNKNPNKNIEELLETVLPYQLVFVLLKESNINKTDNWNTLDLNTKQRLVDNISNLTLEVVDTLDFDRSQVSTGGVSLSEINPNTMESLNVNGMYLIGELLDVDGICGGYNLGFAFISGYLAGLGVNND